MKGFVLQARSGHFKVYLENGEIVDAFARKKTHGSDKFDRQIICGDEVEIQEHKEQTASIEKIYPRKTLIERGSEHRRGRVHAIVANVDHALIVTAADKPRARIASIDRYLIAAEFQNLKPTLVFNKWDLKDEESERQLLIYQNAGYHTISCTALSEPDKTRASIMDIDFKKLYIFGPSGVGKTSIINTILKDNLGRTSAVNEVTGKGRHTTTHIEIRPVENERFIVDTPGLGQWINLGIEPHNLKNYYHEFKGHSEQCKYRNCLHLEEPGCTVREALGNEIHEERYQSYCDYQCELQEEDKRKREGDRRH